MRCQVIAFSPTGGTARAAEMVADALGDSKSLVDLTDSTRDFSDVVVGEGEVALIAAPCFAGRVPAVAMERLASVAGNGAPCVVMNVYGNRAFDDALLEMADGAREAGFNVVAGIAAIAEHSIMRQFATGRPDKADNERLVELAAIVRQALDEGRAVEAPAIPGNRPYLKAKAIPLIPTYEGSCSRCGRCAADCPTAAIDGKTLKADKERCIACMRCIVECPDDARKVSSLLVKEASLAIKKEALTPKEAELFSA